MSCCVPLCQKGHPTPEMNSCQLLLKYMLMNRNSFIKAFHNRVYSFSSGSKFEIVVGPLHDWIDERKSRLKSWMENPPEGQEDPPINPVRAVKRLQDVDGLYNLLGNTMINFMVEKPTPYLTNALASKDDFWNVPVFKRAMTFVFLTRYILGYKSQSQWKNFTEGDYKLNKRCFRRWVEHDRDIFLSSSKFKGLPDHPPPRRIPKRKKKGTTSLSSDSPMKRTFEVGDSTTDDDE